MRIAAYQFAVSGNIIENFKEIESAIYLAKSKNVQLLIFPECSLTGYPSRDITNSSCIDFNLVHAMCDKCNLSELLTKRYVYVGLSMKMWEMTGNPVKSRDLANL